MSSIFSKPDTPSVPAVPEREDTVDAQLDARRRAAAARGQAAFQLAGDEQLGTVTPTTLTGGTAPGRQAAAIKTASILGA